MIIKFRILWIVLLFFPLLLTAQKKEISLIPQPEKIKIFDGELSLNQSFNLFIIEDFTKVSELLYEIPGLSISSSEIIKKVKKQHQKGLRLFKAEKYDNVDPNGYLLELDESGILLKAHSPEAMISGIYTLIQLSHLAKEKSIPYMQILDKPRFAYRGLHLDVSRHFMPLDFLKKYIDIMALYKFNYFHWHLTDGAGWRIEIKKYPELTNKAAWRSHYLWKDWVNNGKQYVEKGTPNASGGFYTQQQARELVNYASSRGITIIPEIEMPGHAEEVLAVYPELSCTGTPYTQGEFCLGNEKTYTFLKDILDEIIDIFPSKYIHIGGDEADKTHWKNCPKCQAIMKKENIKSEDGLQTYAINQIQNYLESKERKLIGWDEILQEGIAKQATIMNWRGQNLGKQAAIEDHQVIMTPEDYLYFDKYQADPRSQPEAIDGYIPLEKVYSYNPMPEGIPDEKKKNILGAQGNLWTEYIPTYQQVEYMAFPRVLALSEVVWSDQQNRSFVNFKKRLQQHYPLLQKLDINYYRPSYWVSNQIAYDSVNRKNTVYLTSEQFTPEIRYTVDGSDPNKTSTVYNLPLELSQTTTVKAASFLDSIRVSPIETIELDVHKGIGKEVIYKTQWEGYPAQKRQTLTNGIKGGLFYSDGQWQGFTKDLNVVVDFERREEISSVAMNFMQVPGPGVYFPDTFMVLVSDNGKNYREIGIVKNQIKKDDPTLTFQKFEFKLPKPIMARYIQVIATNTMGGYIFTDEILIY